MTDSEETVGTRETVVDITAIQQKLSQLLVGKLHDNSCRLPCAHGPMSLMVITDVIPPRADEAVQRHLWNVQLGFRVRTEDGLEVRSCLSTLILFADRVEIDHIFRQHSWDVVCRPAEEHNAASTTPLVELDPATQLETAPTPQTELETLTGVGSSPFPTLNLYGPPPRRHRRRLRRNLALFGLINV
jgi:hypothetical protein